MLKQTIALGLIVCGLVGVAACGGGGSPTAPSTTTGSSTGSTGTTPGSGGSPGGGNSGTTSVAFVQDVQPILNSDCTRCHSASRSDGGVMLHTYANVMRYLTAGDTNSRLIRATRSGGSMNAYLSGDRAAKAETIRAWIVDYKALESR